MSGSEFQGPGAGAFVRSPIKISPIVRFMFTVEREIALNPDLKTRKAYKRFLLRLSEAERRRDNLMRSFVVLDIFAMLFINGSRLQTPIFGVKISEIPIALEALTLLASVSFVFFAISFVNWQAYSAIVDQYAIRDARSHGGDPEFATASDRLSEFFIKIFRSKMNIWNYDFFETTPTARRIFFLVSAFMFAIFFSFLLMHYSAIGVSIYMSSGNMPLLAFLPYSLFVVLANIAALAFLVLLSTPMNFIQVSAAISRDQDALHEAVSDPQKPPSEPPQASEKSQRGESPGLGRKPRRPKRSVPKDYG
ncbi:hypothetical protein [Phreatobacter oligotrophus]|uniref:Uncharacterized protein n=1 Tax=Phreatobacter oligotrophus TaxID=1122261 RepID=A0A2T4Z5M3_9HYPH|nr:hypothetical protein [Phreatobacter oligotrophus]PTM57183.1 hypothetical protein C8P69_104233 [Phreatobacter oligotrophus]